MEIEFVPDKTNHYLAQRYIQAFAMRDSLMRKFPNISGILLVFFFIIGVITLTKFYESNPDTNFYELNNGLGALLAGVFCYVLGMWLYRNALRNKLFNSNSVSMASRKISLEDNYLVFVIKGSKYMYAYSDLLKIEENKNNIFIFIDECVAVYIPTNAFKNIENKNEFVKNISSKIIR